MRKILYSSVALLFFCFSSIAVFAGGDELESVQETVLSEDESEDSVLFDGFQEMDYYMLLQSHIGCGVSLDYYSYGIYGNMTQTAREGEELYLSLNKKWFGNEIEPEDQTDYPNWLHYHLDEHIAGFSPDLEWCITNQGYFETSTYDRMERIYRAGILISENEEKSYYNTIVGKDILCKNPETDRFLIMAEDKRQRIEDLINTIWKIRFDQSKFCLSEDGMLMALVKPDNRHIGIYETEGCTELFEFGFEQMDADWPLEVFQIQGNDQEGWFTFSNGDKAFQFFYPSNEIVPLGEFMFNINISSDGKYCAYYTGSDLLYSTWEVLYLDNWDKFAQMLERWKKVPSGWYIKELDSGLTTYIPVKSMADVGQPPLDGKCMWIQKDKLLELLETEKISDLFSDIQQCIWGEWKINEMYYGGVGWQECIDNKKGMHIQFLPDSIICNGQATGINMYYNQLLAIEDEDARYFEVKFRDLGFRGDYYVEFEASYVDIGQDVCPFMFFLLVSDTELITLSGKSMYKAEKVSDIEESEPLGFDGLYNICYGLWEITGNVEQNEGIKSTQYIGEEFLTGRNLDSFVSCRVFSVKNEKISELVELMDTGNNAYICCYKFSENYFWDEMIIQDEMTAIVVKDGILYWAKRKSDPETDGIYKLPF